MIVLAAAGLVVVLALLIGIRRKTAGDILHLLAAVISAAGAYLALSKTAPAAVSFAASKLEFDASTHPLLAKIAAAAAGPAVFTATFIVLFIVLGLIFHFIAGRRKPGEKANIAAKLILNLIAGVLIAACLIVPAVYYPRRAPLAADAVSKAGMEQSVKIPDLSSFAAPDYLDPLTSPFGRFELEEKTYTVDEGIRALAVLAETSNASSDPDKLGEIAGQIKSDETADTLCGYLSAELAKDTMDPDAQAIMENEASFSVKLEAAQMGLLLEDFLNRKVDKEIPLAKIIEIANEENCRIAINSLREDVIKDYTSQYAQFGTILNDILTSIPKAKEGRGVLAGREAAEIVSIFGLIESRFNGSMPKVTDIDRLVRAISRSTIIRQIVVTATDGGRIKDPWGIGAVISRPLALGVIELAERSISFTLDDLTKQSLLAFFGA